jgi:hypothetical protein
MILTGTIPLVKKLVSISYKQKDLTFFSAKAKMKSTEGLAALNSSTPA